MHVYQLLHIITANNYRWAIRLTDDYKFVEIEVTYNSGINACLKILIYGQDQGDVNENCVCSPSEEMTVIPIDSLPPHCYSPRGDDCSWPWSSKRIA